ncbi:MAG: argininosuccinate lyase [Planctomycetaceae bacterium]|jgi:argininosuccinate lyase|nr:argininosuccinate lyase [Planctomycetaceae bacterium]
MSDQKEKELQDDPEQNDPEQDNLDQNDLEQDDLEKKYLEKKYRERDPYERDYPVREPGMSAAEYDRLYFRRWRYDDYDDKDYDYNAEREEEEVESFDDDDEDDVFDFGGQQEEDKAATSKAWGGVFTRATDSRVEKFTESISFDRRLYEVDIRGSIAHARMLCDVGFLTAEEFGQIESGLVAIRGEIELGQFNFCVEFEDIHMHIERALIDRIGDVGRKLHTGRSRNDQVVTDLRMWMRDSLERVDLLLIGLQSAFVGRCDSDFDFVVPAYTHTRRAQPVLLPHVWLAYCEKLERDRGRLRDCLRRVNILGLGAAALAGTSIPIDRQKTAEYLKFDSVAANSLDVSSDRDFVLEAAFCLVEIAIHMSAFAEDWILWSTAEFNFIRLPQTFCTGSSIMPQKINPDVLELIRGKSARVVGNLQTLIVLTKGLPLAYNRDLQEDKQPIFDSFDTIESILSVAAPLVAGMTVKKHSLRRQLDIGYLDATTLMEHFIKQGIPQRTAHGIVGRIVRDAIRRKKPLRKFSMSDFKCLYSDFNLDAYKVINPYNAVNEMQSYGSTAPEQVKFQINKWKEKLNLNNPINELQQEEEIPPEKNNQQTGE